MDFDSDGIPDVLSGSWPGHLYFFKGKGKGEFEEGKKIKNAKGDEIKIMSASTLFAHDWNGDGKLDLIVGSVQGKVYLLVNEGSAKEAAFSSTPIQLQADGKNIQVPLGDSGPVVADWDGDGLPDLISGCGDGSVLWYRNVGTAKEPKLAAAQTLVPQGKIGGRSKVCVTDWNGDGKLDLLVGDYSRSTELPKLTEAEKAEHKELTEKRDLLMKEHNKASARLLELHRSPPGDTEEAKKERETKIQEAKDEIKKVVQKLTPVQEKLFPKYQGKSVPHGYVWLFLRQDKPAAKDR